MSLMTTISNLLSNGCEISIKPTEGMTFTISLANKENQRSSKTIYNIFDLALNENDLCNVLNTLHSLLVEISK